MKKGKKKVRHSPGPWNIIPKDDGSVLIGRLPKVFQVGFDSDYEFNEEAKANARLIAASPDLLAAAKSVKDAIEKTGEFGAFNPPGYSNEDAEVYDYLIAAIAKAERS